MSQENLIPLDKFIEQVLIDIHKGVKSAREQYSMPFLKNDSEYVKFDLTIVSDQSSSNGKNGNGGIKVMGLAFGGSAKQENSNSSVSTQRITFDVPVTFLTDKQIGETKDRRQARKRSN